MRLTNTEISDIGQAAITVLPPGARVLLFGSRVDDTKRGGDVDLLVETQVPHSPEQVVRLQRLLTAQLYHRWGERKIDVVVCALGQHDARAVVAAARRDGIELART